MKRISIHIFIVTAMFMVACNSYLDINTNPNQATTVTPNLVLPQALAATASVLNRYNTYGSQLGGYSANAGGYGGFNELVSYAYTSNNYNDLWPYTYDNLQDYQYIINQTQGDNLNIHFNAVAQIMKVHGFQLLVDAFSNVPYSQALLGADNLTPAYDQGKDIYAALAVELDTAIAKINRGQAMATKNPIDNYDIVFKGDMTKWLQFANTLKLRLMVRGNGIVTFSNTAFDPAGFLTSDALINPGYTQDINRQNPAWNTWAFAYTGSAGNKAWVPTLWMLSWYDGTNLQDHDRAVASYYQYGAISTLGAIVPGASYKPGTYAKISLTGGLGSGNADIVVSAAGLVTKVTVNDSKGYVAGDIVSAATGDIGGLGGGFSVPISAVLGSVDIANQLGRESVNNPKCPNGSRWYSGYDRTGGKTTGSSVGILKGYDAGYPLMTAAESYFLQAEGSLNGFAVPLGDAVAFNNGISASFTYLYTKPDGSLSGNPTTATSSYITNNPGNYLVDYASAGSPAQKLEAIITQKYIALNFINSHEGWNEYRRTGYPTTTGWPSATTTFASSVSQSSRADKLPVRIMYPSSEAQYNPVNNPTGISPFTSLIFWAK